MYTELKTYQIIIALLKKWGIRHCVLSAGSRNVPFVHSVEEDSFFHCYSVVDERSAGYFALGLSQQIHEPVIISCTSSTATCNYWPPVAEAYYQGVPLIVLTSDRNPAMLGQWEDQMIDQVGMYDRHVRKSVNLPEVHNEDDFIFCQRLVNEAFLELNHHGTGPVHINIPMKAYNNSFNVKELPDVIKIERIDVMSHNDTWNAKITRLKQAKRIMIIGGQDSFVSEELKKYLDLFSEKYNAVIIAEYMANIGMNDKVINPTVCMDTRYIIPSKFNGLLPEIVISFGYNMTAGLKEMLRKYPGKFEHWSIQEDGKAIDMYRSLTTIFECSAEYFFTRCSTASDGINDGQYYKLLKDYADSVVVPDFDYCNIYAIRKVVENIPSGSILHLSINDSIRITNFFKIKPDIKVYANIGTHGIDGCLSSFLGQAYVSEGLAYLIIGDLSLFYDMNALRIRHIKNNVRILMINNHGGEEFYFNRMWKNKASDLHTTARHKTKAEGWVNENDFIYLSAFDKESFDVAYKTFMKTDTNKPIFLEVFTEMSTDAKKIYDFFDLSRPKDLQSEIIRQSKEFVKRTIGQEKAQKIVNIIKGK